MSRCAASQTPRSAEKLKTKVTLVDLTIAVIVQTIAALFCRLYLQLTKVPPRDAAQQPRRADTQEASVTRLSASRVLLVNLTITVIVLSITALLLRLCAIHTADLPFDTAAQADGAGTKMASNLTGQAPAWILLVQLAIAVIINAVTALRERSLERLTAQFASSTMKDPR